MADLVAYLDSVQYFAVSGEARRGREVARAKGCLGCHSVRGEGGKAASDLARARDLDSPTGVIAGLWNHSFVTERRPGDAKSPWLEIRAQEMADLAAFLQTLGRPR
jgi:mono/diheme cytochrome c family protein